MNKLKINYSPSKSEFILLISLLIVAITALTVNYLILPQWSSFSDSRQRFDSENAMVENLRTEYAKLDSYKEEDAKLQTDLDGMRKVLPDYFSEEEIIASVDKNAVSSGLKVMGIAFSGAATDTQSAFLAGLKLSSAPKTAEATGSSSSAAGGDSDYIRSERISLTYSGSYENVVNFLSAFESQTRQVYFRTSTLSRADDGSLSGSLTMLVFSSGKAADPNDPNYPGYDYDAPAAPGKGDPFTAFAGYSGVTGSASTTLTTPDFYVILNTYDDNSDKILMGKYPVSGAQVASDDNQIVTANLTLSKTGTKCSYKYALGDKSYSGSFALNDTQTSLSVSILSRARKSSMDNVGVTLNVQNNTGIPVIVTVKNDDATNPRFQLGTTSGSVQVVK